MSNPTRVHEWLARTARELPEKPAIISGGRIVTYRELDRQSDCLADALTSLGMAPHDRVVIFLDNSVETVISLYGTLKAGGVFVILNAAAKPDKLACILA